MSIKKINYILLTFLLMFVGINVKALDVTFYGDSMKGVDSNSCSGTSMYCATIVNNSIGLRISIVDGFGNQIGGTKTVNFWPNSKARDIAVWRSNPDEPPGSSYDCNFYYRNLSSSIEDTAVDIGLEGLSNKKKEKTKDGKLIIYTQDMLIADWYEETYFGGDKKIKDNIKTIIEQLHPTVDKIEDHYGNFLKIEPIYILQEMVYNRPGDKNRYCHIYEGTTKEIIDRWSENSNPCGTNSDPSVCKNYDQPWYWSWGEYFINGGRAHGEDGWNVTRNLIFSMVTTCNNGKGGVFSTDTGNCFSKDQLGTYATDNIGKSLSVLNNDYIRGKNMHGIGIKGRSGLGVAYISITDLLPEPKVEEFPKTQCEKDFDEIAKKNGNVVSMDKRIDLYHEYHDKYNKNYNNLLNMNKTKGVDACTQKKCDDLNTRTRCLWSLTPDIGVNKDKLDLSCYNDILKNDKNINVGYCISRHRLINSLSIDNNFKALSGQMILSNSTPEFMRGTILHSCFIFEDNPSSTYKSNFVSNVEFKYKGENVIANNSDSYEIKNLDKKKGFVEFKTKVNYKLYGIFSYYGNGKIKRGYYKKNGVAPCRNCNFLGYGIISKFNEETEEGKMPFKVTYNYYKGSSKLNTITSEPLPEDACKYKLYKKLICKPGDMDCPENINEEKLNLEFRIIDTSNPFPGKSGNGRKVGRNWCDEDNCTVNNNKIISDVIFNANDSYNTTGEGSIYTPIRLDRETMTKVREYNKDHSYDDFETLNCGDDLEDCTSPFLDSLGIRRRK